MKDKGGKLKSKNPELFRTEPRKSNSLAYLKTDPYQIGTFKWYANPQIKQGPHVTEVSKKKNGTKRSLGKKIGAKGSYPF